MGAQFVTILSILRMSVPQANAMAKICVIGGYGKVSRLLFAQSQVKIDNEIKSGKRKQRAYPLSLLVFDKHCKKQKFYDAVGAPSNT